MEFAHVTNTSYDGASGAADQFSVDYDELVSIGHHLVELAELHVATGYQGNGGTEDFLEIQGVLNLTSATKSLQLLNRALLPATSYRTKAGENLGIIGQALLDVAALYRDSERQVAALNDASTASSGAKVIAAKHDGFADGYYASAEAAQAEADRLQKEQEKAARKAEKAARKEAGKKQTQDKI